MDGIGSWYLIHAPTVLDWYFHEYIYLLGVLRRIQDFFRYRTEASFIGEIGQCLVRKSMTIHNRMAYGTKGGNSHSSSLELILVSMFTTLNEHLSDCHKCA